jgi:hypothetical protein
LDAPDIFNAPERLCETARYREIARLDAYFRGNQYDGRADWYTGETGNGERVPLRERKPCIIYPLPKAATNEAVRFAIGEGRFPTLAVEDVDADDAVRPELTVSEAEAEQLTKLVGDLARTSHLKSAALQMMRSGLSCKTAPVVLGIRRGEIALTLPRPQDCFPAFRDGDPSAEVERMVWCYPFPKEVQEGKTIMQRMHYFRRDFTATECIVYRDAEAAQFGATIQWVVDEEATAKARHNFGFCPVVWIRNLPESHCSDIDGTGLYAGLEDEFDALNFALSQQHRGINYFGTPQAYETNVAEGEQPAAVVRTAKPRGEDPVKGGAFGVNPKKARALAPDEIWSYSGEAHLGILETSGKAFEVSGKHIMSVRARILEALSVMLLDPETAMQKDLAGVAIQRLYAPMFAFVDELREHWWEHGFAKVLSMMLRIVAVTKGERLLIPGAMKAAPILQRFMVDTTEGPLWIPPTITPTWGDYMSPSPEDIKTAVETAVMGKDGGVFTGKTATAYVAPYVGVADPDQEAEDAEAEGAESAHAALETAVKAVADKQEPESDAEPEADQPGGDSEPVETAAPSKRGVEAPTGA